MPDTGDSVPSAPESGGTLFSQLKQALSSYTILGPKEFLQLFSITRFQKLRKGEHIIRAGERDFRTIFVLRGLLRNYIIDSSGEERTILFVPEFKNAGSSATILKGEPSVENIVAVEDSILAVGDQRRYEEMARSSSALLAYQVRVLKELLAFTIEQSWFHVLLKPEQRYQEFCRRYPKLEQRVTQRDLASYLGVTPTSLSRMRARIAQMQA